MARHRLIADEAYEVVNADGRRIVAQPGDLVDLPDYTEPQPELWEPAPAPHRKTKTATPSQEQE